MVLGVNRKEKIPWFLAISSMNQGIRIRNIPLAIGVFELSATGLLLFVVAYRVLGLFARCYYGRFYFFSEYLALLHLAIHVLQQSGSVAGR